VCVECLLQTDCAVGKLCAPSGVCVDGCDLAQGKLCAANLTCCNKLCVDTRSDLLNCGGCGQMCDLTHAQNASCDGTACSYACAPGFGDCNTAAPDVDGCETPLNTITDCTACAAACDTTHSTGASCDGTKCRYTGCTGTFSNCDGSGLDTNGCESDLTSTTTCGGCGNACDTVNSNGAMCVGGGCSYSSCAADHLDCSPAAPDVDGCETNVSTVMACGACNAVCDQTNATAASCTAGACSYTCKGNFLDCDQTGRDTNGCETPNNTSNCGACGRSCTPTNASNPQCNGAACSYTCNAGYVDCDADAGQNVDGCECAGNACCGTGCQVMHSTGLTQGAATSWRDCTAINTFSLAEATAACIAFTGDPSGNSCSDFCCGGCNNYRAICSTLATNCGCFAFSGGCTTAAGAPVACTTTTTAGHSGFDATCQVCPSATSPTWH
jgi:hypothetical protein